jgi:biopolymer transport protein ExbD
VSFSLGDSEERDDLVAEINVTPLTDIFLVLLIIFMVTSTALTQQGPQVNLPKARGAVAPSAGIVITATADHQVAIDGKTIPREQLEEVLRQSLTAATDRSVVLRGDREVILEDAVEIMTIAKSAGADRIAIATEPGGKGATR